jgi:DNA-binding PadR family transcriptional regulator
MGAPLRLTDPLQRVLEVLLQAPTEQRFSRELGERAGFGLGRIHPVLARLEGVGWLASGWEDVDPLAGDHPARRWYRLTADGLQAAHAALATARRPAPARQFRPLPGSA